MKSIDKITYTSEKNTKVAKIKLISSLKIESNFIILFALLIFVEYNNKSLFPVLILLYYKILLNL